MRGRECFVEIDVHHVEAHVAWPGDAEHRVEVGTVVVHQTTGRMNGLGYLGYVLFKHSHRVGIGHHQGGNRSIEFRLKVFDIDSTVWQTLYFYNFEPGHSCRCRIGTVRRIRHKHAAAVFVGTAQEIGAYDHKAGIFTMRAGKRVERKLGHAADFAKGFFKSAIYTQCALHGIGRLCRVQVGNIGYAHHRLVDLGIIFHRARPQGIEARIHAEIVTAAVGIMAHDCGLVDLGKCRAFFAAQFCW